MSIHCDVIFRESATPEQLTALGTALWRWCSRAAGDTRTYQFLDNQALADLIAGKLPAASPPSRLGDRWRSHFLIRDRASSNRAAAIDSLRGEIPAHGVEEILVDGASWNLSEGSS